MDETPVGPHAGTGDARAEEVLGRAEALLASVEEAVAARAARRCPTGPEHAFVLIERSDLGAKARFFCARCGLYIFSDLHPRPAEE